MSAPSPVHTVDVAHPPRRPADVEADLLAAWNTVRNSGSLRFLKIVHGFGSTGKGGSTRELVRNWLFARGERPFRGVIYGEDYTLFNPRVQQMRAEAGQFADPDLSAPNPGVTIVWVK